MTILQRRWYFSSVMVGEMIPGAEENKFGYLESKRLGTTDLERLCVETESSHHLVVPNKVE